jgi:hypothetical protein
MNRLDAMGLGDRLANACSQMSGLLKSKEVNGWNQV